MTGRDADKGTEDYVLAAWKLPLMVAAIAVSIVAGFYLGGPGLGMAVGALAAGALLAMAIRNPPQPPIVPCATADGRDRALLVLGGPLGDTTLSAAAVGGDAAGTEVLVLAPLRQRFLDRWACDTAAAREAAQARLVVTLAELAKAGVPASARLGDEDPVQAVEDTVRSFPATRVALVAAPGKRADAVAAALRSRLSVPFLRLDGSLAADCGVRESPAAGCSSSAAAPRRRWHRARGRATPASAAGRRRSR